MFLDKDMETIKFDNCDKIFEKCFSLLEDGSTVLTSSARSARKIVFLYRNYKLSKQEKIWKSPNVFTLKFFIDLNFNELITEKRINSYEESLFLYYKAVKLNRKNQEEITFVDYALEHLKHYNFAEINKIILKKDNGGLFEFRNKILDDFYKLKNDNKLLSYSEEMEELKKAISEKIISLPSKIAVLDFEEFSPLEKDFIKFLEEKSTIFNFKIDETKENLENEVTLYDDIQSEVEATLNEAISLWESGERSIAICYFEDSYKKVIEESLSNFKNNEKDHFRYHFEEGVKISELLSFEIVKTILTLSQYQTEKKLFSLVSNHIFKPKVSKNSLKELFFTKGEKNEEFVKKFKKLFKFGDELDIFLKGGNHKIGDIVGSLRKIINDHYLNADVNTTLAKSFNEILEHLTFFETIAPEYEISLSEYEKLFSATIGNKSIYNDSSEFCGIQVLSYDNCLYQNFKYLFVLGANLSVLPKIVPTYPLFSSDEKKECETFDLEKHIQKEKNFLKKVISTNKKVFFSRSKKYKDKPFLSSPFLKGNESEKEWGKYNFEINRYFLPQNLISSVNTKEGEYKNEPVVGLELPKIMRVTEEISNLLLCPFLFFAKYYLKAKEPEEISLLLDYKGFGSFLHTLIAKMEEKIKDRTEINLDEINILVSEFLREIKISSLEKESFHHFLFGYGEKKGFIDNYLKFENKRIQENWRILDIERMFEKEIEQLDNAVVKGKIDRVEISNDNESIKIIDFKTKTKSSHFDVKDKIQLDFYRRIVDYKQSNISTCIVKLLDEFNFQEPSNSDNGSERFERTINSFNKIKHGNVKPDPYPPNSNSPCEYCNFDLICHIDKYENISNDEGNSNE